MVRVIPLFIRQSSGCRIYSMMFCDFSESVARGIVKMPSENHRDPSAFIYKLTNTCNLLKDQPPYLMKIKRALPAVPYLERPMEELEELGHSQLHTALNPSTYYPLPTYPTTFLIPIVKYIQLATCLPKAKSPNYILI